MPLVLVLVLVLSQQIIPWYGKTSANPTPPTSHPTTPDEEPGVCVVVRPASSVGAGDPSAVIFFFCALSRFRWRFWADPARFIEKRERASLRLTFTFAAVSSAY